MAEVSNAELYQLMLQVRSELGNLSRETRELAAEVKALNGGLSGNAKDIAELRELISQQAGRLDRNERRSRI